MSPLVISALILAALAAGFILSRFAAKQPTPQVVLDAEAEAWAKLEQLVEFVADSKGDAKTIAAAQARIAQRNARVADFKAKVGALPSA